MDKEVNAYPISVGHLDKNDLCDLDHDSIESIDKELYLTLCQAMFSFVSNNEDVGKCMPEFLMIKTRPFLKWFQTLGYGDVKTLLSKPEKLREILIKNSICEKTVEQHKSYVRQIIKQFDT